MPKSRPKIEVSSEKDFTKVTVGDAFLIITDDRRRLVMFGGEDFSVYAQEPLETIADRFNSVVMKVQGVTLQCDYDGWVSVHPPADGSMGVYRGPAIPAAQASVEEPHVFRFRSYKR